MNCTIVKNIRRCQLMYNVWWMTEENNYGDLLTPYIFDHFGIPYCYADLDNADTICIGSIVKYATDNTLVLGSGLIKRKQKPNPNAIYKFVRGPLTRNRVIELGGTCPEIYGDAAFLLPLFWKECAKEHEVGIVPHIYNYDEVKEKYPQYHIIDLTQDPKIVTQEITKCKRIISSSLHGLIVAHAYNIPAAWVKFSTKLVGDTIKFQDYYASINVTPQLSSIETPKYSLGKIDINPIIDVFKNL
jgi:pyruvyltransferase